MRHWLDYVFGGYAGYGKSTLNRIYIETQTLMFYFDWFEIENVVHYSKIYVKQSLNLLITHHIKCCASRLGIFEVNAWAFQ